MDLNAKAEFAKYDGRPAQGLPNSAIPTITDRLDAEIGALGDLILQANRIADAMHGPVPEKDGANVAAVPSSFADKVSELAHRRARLEAAISRIASGL